MAGKHATDPSKEERKLLKKRITFSIMPVLIGAFFGFVFQRAHVEEKFQKENFQYVKFFVKQNRKTFAKILN